MKISSHFFVLVPICSSNSYSVPNVSCMYTIHPFMTRWISILCVLGLRAVVEAVAMSEVNTRSPVVDEIL